MNIYDFDKTIFDGDSSVCFFKFSLVHHPLLVIKSIFIAIPEGIKYIFHKSDFGKVKSKLFNFVSKIDDLDNYMASYVKRYKNQIKTYYYEKQQDNDVVITASFEFIVKPLCDSLGIKSVIGTKFDTKKGTIIGKNCKGEEKVKRFKEIYKNASVEEAYSDSLSDKPMLNLASKAYLVKGKSIEPFKE